MTRRTRLCEILVLKYENHKLNVLGTELVLSGFFSFELSCEAECLLFSVLSLRLFNSDI